jgi:hypothetical protein
MLQDLKWQPLADRRRDQQLINSILSKSPSGMSLFRRAALNLSTVLLVTVASGKEFQSIVERGINECL